ncbi:MAG: transposase, partial [Candidatus Omnitrophica bacterium]|nr:transposase [Candidatus Omnitrophota bacterium]
ECLKKTKEKTQSKIYAYCLMTNHVHFLIEPSSEDGLAEMMQSIGRRYVPYINLRYQRTGTLWEGRYKSSLVDKDEYFAACSRYIELNPVRAKIVASPEEYPWSSFRSKTTGECEDILDRDYFYLDIGKTDKERQENYYQWVLEGIPEEELAFIRLTTQRCGIMGNDIFHGVIEKALGRSVILKTKGRPNGI